MTAVVLRADARRLPLPDGCVDLIVTSPPYFGLRSYTDNGEHYDGQIGSEATPAEWLANLLECTREWVRVLKPSGSIFVNLGDKYSAHDHPMNNGGGVSKRAFDAATQRRTGHGEYPGLVYGNARHKSLLGLPWRYALACMDELGLILRRDIVWSKPNGLPESVTDRCRSSHEYVFHLVKQPRYYAAVDEIREPHTRSWGGSPNGGHTYGTMKAPGEKDANLPNALPNPLGKLPGSVWSMPERETLVRSVLQAVSAGYLTIDEAERLITGGPAWTGSSGSTPRSSAPMGAGTGSASWMTRATGITGAPTTGSEPSTGSPTNSGSVPSLAASPSTTSAATGDASTQPTSKPSPSVTTSGEDARPPRPIASTGTSSPLPTPTAEPEGRESAGSACERESAITTHGDVWSIPSQPLVVPAHLGVDHFAAFPLELPRRIIAGWSPPGICTACGEGRRPVVDKTLDLDHVQKRTRPWVMDGTEPNGNSRGLNGDGANGRTVATITGYACACTPFHWQEDDTARWKVYHFDRWTPPPTTPAVVLDPFAGTGTTMLAASALGRAGIGCDLSMDYARLARWRTQDRGEIAKAMQVPKPPPVVDGQEALFT